MNHYYEVAPPPYRYFSGDNVTIMVIAGVALFAIIITMLLNHFLSRGKVEREITVAQIEADSRIKVAQLEGEAGIKVAELEAMAVTRRAEIESSSSSATEIG